MLVALPTLFDTESPQAQLTAIKAAGIDVFSGPMVEGETLVVPAGWFVATYSNSKAPSYWLQKNFVGQDAVSIAALESMLGNGGQQLQELVVALKQ